MAQDVHAYETGQLVQSNAERRVDDFVGRVKYMWRRVCPELARMQYGGNRELSFTLTEDEFNTFKFLYWYMHRTDPKSQEWRYFGTHFREHRELS